MSRYTVRKQVLAAIAEEDGPSLSRVERSTKIGVLPNDPIASPALADRAASLALLESVTNMAPRHATALRCHAMALAAVGLLAQALVRADQAVSVGVTNGCTQAASLTSSTYKIPSDPQRTGVPEADIDASADERIGSRTPSRVMGFMRSSKISITVGGLLTTGGGEPEALDIAKSLVLRGCLRQKSGERKAALEDYQAALEVCRTKVQREDVPSSDNKRTHFKPLNHLSLPRGEAVVGNSRPMASHEDMPSLSEAWRIESLIHHNLVTLHIAALHCGDVGAAVHQVHAGSRHLQYISRNSRSTNVGLYERLTITPLRELLRLYMTTHKYDPIEWYRPSVEAERIFGEYRSYLKRGFHVHCRRPNNFLTVRDVPGPPLSRSTSG